METCPTPATISAYYDRELDPARMNLVRRHLAGCAACREELAQLGNISNLLSKLDLSADANVLSRLHRQVDQYQRQRGIQRFAEVCTGVAASILVFCGLWMGMQPLAKAAPQAMPVWESTLVQVPNEARPEMPAAEDEMAQWLALDLTGAGNG